METELTKSEQSELARLCKVVDEGLSSFLAVGTALVEINEGRLYRQNHETFEAFVKERWGISRQRAYQLMEAVEVKDELTKIFDNPSEVDLFTAESQLRELSRVGTEALPSVLEKIVEKCKSENLKPSANVIKDVVAKELGKDKDSLGREVKHLALARKHLSGLRLALSNLGAGKRFDEYWANVEEWING